MSPVKAADEVIEAARSRAAALADGDGERLRELLDDDFRWTSHVGDTYGREEYIRRNTTGHTVWKSQDLGEPEVIVCGDTAVLIARVTDVIRRDGEDVVFRMPVTQVWTRRDDEWKCLAGHAGPRVDEVT